MISTWQYKGGYICEGDGATRPNGRPFVEAQVGARKHACKSVASAERWIAKVMRKPNDYGVTMNSLAMPTRFYVALEEFAAEHGDDWRTALHRQWMNASASPELIQLRNSTDWRWCVAVPFAFETNEA